eukprot:11214760-Lingulodinium_polyedra.AAC.1
MAQEVRAVVEVLSAAPTPQTPRLPHILRLLALTALLAALLPAAPLRAEEPLLVVAAVHPVQVPEAVRALLVAFHWILPPPDSALRPWPLNTTSCSTQLH